MTPLEQNIIDEFKNRLDQDGVDDQVVNSVVEGFSGEKLPSVDTLVSLIKKNGGSQSA
ncbi:hypothetical protein [Mycobacteroides abscessus]|uniref:hypothetical protein n=1 Tax=Mycobacteroides abscessus TaxID=36809 RepID=UPI0012FFFE65|nr:hypothetical protein [Mycobacteroides abscessus]